MTVARAIMMFFCVLLWLCMSVANAAAVPGLEILNKAFLSYIDGYSGERVEVESNTSTIRVAELYRFSLSAEQELEAAPYDELVFAHTLTNTGNLLDEYALRLINESGDQGDLVNLQLTIDINKNGQIDASEPVAGSTVLLGAGKSIVLLVSGTTPGSVVAGDLINFSLSATSTQEYLPTLVNTNTVIALEPAQLSLSLTQTPECSAVLGADEIVTYQLTITNSNDQIPLEQQVMVDGELRTGVLFQVPIPDGLLLQQESAFDTQGYESVTMLQQRSESADDDSWISYALWNTDVAVGKIAVLYPAELFEKDELITLSFSLVVQPLATGGSDQFSVSAEVYIDNDQKADVTSNTLCSQTFQLAASKPATLRFIAPDATNDAWLDTQYYRIDSGKISSSEYQVEQDGVYIELTTTVDEQSVLTSSNGVNYVSVQLRSSITGDDLIVLLREVSGDTGVYRSVVPVRLNETSAGSGAWCPVSTVDDVSGDLQLLDDATACDLLSATNDELIVEFTDSFNAQKLTDSASVSPASYAFNSTTLKPVAGVTVSLYANAQIAIDPASGDPLSFVSDELGRYFIPPLAVGPWFHIQVDPPEGYIFPSSVAADQFPSYSVTDLSYGKSGFMPKLNGQFSVSAESAPTVIDIPLDPQAFSAFLTVEKIALDDLVQVGETVQYEITVSNQGEAELDDVSLLDQPPYGFRLVDSTVTLGGEPLADYERLQTGADLSAWSTELDAGVVSDAYQFDIGFVAPGETRVLRYQLQATPAALQSDGVNTVTASAQSDDGVVVTSQSSRAIVDVVSTGVFSDRAILFGKVFVDSTCDWVQNKSEWPIGGVKLYLQDGSFVVTDEDGQFSLYGLRPGLHVLKVDTLTIPEGLTLKPLDNRNAADAESRFVDLTEGDFHRADFATGCPTEDPDGVFAKLEQRNRDLRGSWLIDEASRFDPDGQSRLANERQRVSADGDLSNGYLTEPRTTTGAAPVAPPQADVLPLGKTDVLPASAMASTTPEAAISMASPIETAAQITAAQAKQGTWLWPEGEFSTDGRFMVVVRSGMNPQLMVNGVAVSDAQVGERIGNLRERAELIAWYGVKLKSGQNDVKVVATDNFNNVRVLAAGNFKRPAAGVSIQLRTRQDTLPADGGRTVLPVDVVINDANGYPANGVHFVTLTASAGDFVEQDLQATEPGLQVRIDNGRGKIHLRSSELAGRLQLTARSGSMRTSLQLVQVAAARPLLGAGLIELGGRWSHLSEQDDRADLESGFENTARAAVFLKGRVKGDMKMTLSYDSDKDKDTDLLRDINPNEHYPTFGDASVKGFEAQSRSKLYAKLEKDKHSIMWGDYLTDSRSELDDLARVQRTLTGANAIYENDRHLLQLFAARVSDLRASEFVRGNGTAMLFRLTGAPIVANSEIIEIIVRDRDNPGIIVSEERLVRYTDYTLDNQSGLLNFRDVIPSVDEDLNPVFIRSSYDKASDLDEYTVAGLRWQYSLTDQWTTGFTFTADKNPLTGYQINGFNTAGVLALDTTVSVSTARMTHEDGTAPGTAQRVRVEHFWRGSRDHKSVMSWARADATFTNTDSGVSAGRQEWQFEHKQPLTQTINSTFMSTLSQSTTDDTHYGSAGLTLDKRFSKWSVNAGMRRVWSSDGIRSLSFNTVLLGAERRYRLPGDRTLSVGVDAERGLSDASRYRYGLDTRVQLFKHVNLYMRYEREQQLAQQSLSGEQEGSRQWILGVESDVLPSTQLYSEYRMRGSYTGRSMETASGVRGRYQLRDGLSVNPSLEVIDEIQGGDSEDSIAVSLGVSDSRNPNRKLTAQAELRDTSGSRYYGFRATLAQRLNLDWTTLVREEFTRQNPDVGQLLSRHQFTLGLARRPKLDNRHHSVFLANWKEEYGPEDGQDSRTYILSTHHNRQFGQGFTLSGRAGAKWQSTHYDLGDVGSRIGLLDMRLSKDLNRRWEVDFRGGLLGVGDGGGRRFSLGAGVAWIVDRNIRLGVAYNISGFSDVDLDAEGLNQKGFQLGLQFKFDEDWFQWLSD